MICSIRQRHAIVSFRSITAEGCMLDFAVHVAQDAGRLLRDRVGTTIDIGHKGDINIVTDVDLASERLIREAIASHYPRHQVLGEEGGLTDSGSDYRWVVDPLDGT